jgi:hypothetical protein
VRDNFTPVDDFGANPSPQSSPLLKGERWQSPADPKLTINEHYQSNFPQTLPGRFFHLKASQHESLDPSVTRFGLLIAETPQARD